MTTEKTFTRIALTDPPAGICQRCSELAMEHLPTQTKFAFCEHTATGAMLTPGSTWYLVKTHGGPTGWVKRYYIHTDFPYTSLPYAESMQKPAPMPPSNPSMQPAGIVNSGALNVRSGPGTNYRTIAVISGGTTVLLLGRSSGGSWLKVKIPTGTVGWVRGYYITTSYPTNSLPVG